MSLRQQATTRATLAAELDSLVHAFPCDCRQGAREVVDALAAILAHLDQRLRADIDAELALLRTGPHNARRYATDGSQPGR